MAKYSKIWFLFAIIVLILIAVILTFVYDLNIFFSLFLALFLVPFIFLFELSFFLLPISILGLIILIIVQFFKKNEIIKTWLQIFTISGTAGLIDIDYELNLAEQTFYSGADLYRIYAYVFIIAIMIFLTLKLNKTNKTIYYIPLALGMLLSAYFII